MTVLPDDVIPFNLPDTEFNEAVTFAYHALTHQDHTHADLLRQWVQVLMDELAERMVIHWLRSNGKFAEPATDKGATHPALRHEIWVTDIRGVNVKAAIYTALSTHKSDVPSLLRAHSLSVDPDQMCGINFSVAYWLQLREKPRIKIPSLQQAAIIGWASDKNFREVVKSREAHHYKYVAIKFCDLRPVNELLQFLV